MSEIELILPKPNEDSKPFWDGLKERRLLLQKCGECGKIRHYPRPVCDECYSMEVDWVEASRKGKIHTWSESHYAFHFSFKKDLPLLIATVDLDEGVRLKAQVRGAKIDAMAVDKPVTIGFEDINEDVTVPVVHLAE